MQLVIIDSRQLNRIASTLAAGIILVTSLGGCGTIPDVSAFNDQTVRLYTANAGELGALSSKHATLVDNQKRLEMKGRIDPNDFNAYAMQWKTNRQKFDSSVEGIKQVLAQSVSYSEALAELAAAGSSGAEAGDALLTSLNGFSEALGGNVIGASRSTVSTAVKAIADAYTKREATKSLREAVSTAQPAVDQVAKVLVETYSGAGTSPIQNTAEALHAEALRIAKNLHGRNVINFCNTVDKFNEAYFFQAKKQITPKDGDPSNWRGYCSKDGKPDPECTKLLELQGVKVTRELYAGARPTCDAYEAQVAELEKWRAERRKNAKVISAAFAAWAKEHAKVAKALEQDRSVNASNLRAILDELKIVSIDG